jgi:hypothetical protein
MVGRSRAGYSIVVPGKIGDKGLDALVAKAQPPQPWTYHGVYPSLSGMFRFDRAELRQRGRTRGEQEAYHHQRVTPPEFLAFSYVSSNQLARFLRNDATIVLPTQACKSPRTGTAAPYPRSPLLG